MATVHGEGPTSRYCDLGETKNFLWHRHQMVFCDQKSHFYGLCFLWHTRFAVQAGKNQFSLSENQEKGWHRDFCDTPDLRSRLGKTNFLFQKIRRRAGIALFVTRSICGPGWEKPIFSSKNPGKRLAFKKWGHIENTVGSGDKRRNRFSGWSQN